MMSRLSRFCEMLDEQFARTLQALLCQYNRLGFSHRIIDHALLVQAIHRSPVVSLPGATAVMERQKEQREHHLVHFIFVIFHARIVHFCVAIARACHTKASNQSLEPTSGRCDAALHIMKIRPLQATLALASGGSAPSR